MAVHIDRSEREAGSVVRITLDREAKLNALDWELLRALRDAARTLADDERLRAVVLTGAGTRAFSAGADLEVLRGHTVESARQFITLIHDANTALRRLPVPVICRINGYCIGAGLEMAVSCDLRIAVTSAELSMPEVQVGLPSVIEAALLPRLIGWGRTGELLYTGVSIDAATACRWGLIEKACDAALIDEQIDIWLRAILRAGPLAVRAQKRLMNEWSGLALDQAVRRGIDYLEAAYETAEPAERIAGLRR